MKTVKTKPLKSASALIIAVILTSLLAIIGVMFVMVARVDKMATSSISANKELNFAVEAVVAKVSQELVLDVPRSDSNGIELSEYYDYPGNGDKWLASLEPYDADPNPLVLDLRWRRISDIYGRLDANNLQAEIIADYQPSIAEDVNADADGDGVADSKWVELEDMNSNKGKPIYAAVRVVDNGAMVNVNTVFANPGGPDERKGDMLTDIYIDGVIKKPGGDLITTFLDNRSNASNASTYYTEAARRIENPDTTTNYYKFYDISEELSLRNRFILVPGQAKYTQPWLSSMTRLESYGPPQCLATTLRETTYGNSFAPYTSSDFGAWKQRLDPFDVGKDPNKNNYDFRHLLTTCNMDRIITPDCSKMTNINDADVNELNSSIRRGLLDTNYPDVNGVAAQITVNLLDFRDSDSDVYFFTPDVNGPTYYGFERPCVYISELACRFRELIEPGPIPATYHKSYAIELYKPYYPDDDYPEPNQWRLNIQDYGTVDVDWSGTKYFHVILFEDPCASLAPVNFDSSRDPNFPSRPYVTEIPTVYTDIVFASGKTVSLERLTGAGWIPVDSVYEPNWLVPDVDAINSLQRDITQHKCIRRLWDSAASSPTLGTYNSYFSSDPNVIQAHPENKPFTNVGEIGMLFRKSAYSQGPNPIDTNDTEATARINLADPNLQQLFEYLTVFDPNSDTIDNDGDGLIDALDTNTPEYKVAGRININTAPWYVLAQLPWMKPDIVQAIVSYRDTPVVNGFKSIGELMQVNKMGYYANDVNEKGDLTGFPDLTPGGSTGDGAPDDFEERDVIFARISNLVTVRSDVFTAYILVRIGKDGPQKRVMAILDRSNVYSPTDKVRVIALHPVPDPR